METDSAGVKSLFVFMSYGLEVVLPRGTKSLLGRQTRIRRLN